jgi:uncharacterized protein (DUF2235 family)
MTRALIYPSGVPVKNIALCFDRASRQPGMGDATNAERLFRMIDTGVAWYDPGLPTAERGGVRRALRRREAAIQDARTAIAEAYRFLCDRWEPGDRIYLFGVGRGGYCATALARLLGVVGLDSEFTDFVLSTYATPRTARTEDDWRRVAQVFAELADSDENAVPVAFLGLWDALRVPGVAGSTGSMCNVDVSRHAVAIDGPPGRLAGLDAVWFRGAHCDVAGGTGACGPLADIALDWMLDGAAGAGLAMRSRYGYNAPTPRAYDAVAGSARTVSLRTVPDEALVHASVELYLREHPEYWRRLPRHVVWADTDWVARSERLAPAAITRQRPPAPVLEVLAS